MNCGQKANPIKIFERAVPKSNIPFFIFKNILIVSKARKEREKERRGTKKSNFTFETII